MANTAVYIPNPANIISGSVGVPFSQTFTFDFASDVNPNVEPFDIGLVSDVGVAPNTGYLTGGTQIFFGVNLLAPTGNPTTDLSITISGTPTQNGRYYVYVRGRWDNPDVGPTINNAAVKTYTIDIGGGPPLSVTPAADINTPTPVTPSAQLGTAYVSDQFTIANGGGPYTVTLTNAPNTIGLSSTPSFPGSVVTSLSLAGTGFYLVGTPQAATAGQTITIRVQDNSTAQSYAGTYYKFICVNNTGGSMNISEVSRHGYPVGTPYCVQQHSFDVTYSAGTSGTLPYLWSTTGVLPPGLSMSTSNNQGVISGVPTTNGSYSFNVVVNDDASHSATVPVTLDVALGANYTGGPLPALGAVNSPYGPTPLVAIGGAGGTNRWRIKTRTPSLVEAPGVYGGMTISPPGSNSAGWTVVSSSSVTIGGTPNTPVPAGSWIVAQPGVDNGFGGFVNGEEIAFPVEITGSNALSITPSTLGIWTQNQSRLDTITVVGGTGPYTWGAPTGLPTGINGSFGTGSSGTFSGGYSSYGAFQVGIGVTDFASNTGARTWNLTVAPDIWTNDTLNSGTRGNSYSDSLVFNGGDNTGFTYSVNTLTLPLGLSYAVSGAGNNTLTFTTGVGGSIQQVAGTYNIAVGVTVPTTVIGGSYTKNFLIPIVITGSGVVHLTPFATTLCVKDSKAFPAYPKVRVGAIVTGGLNNTYTVTPPGGWTGQDGPGPFASNQGTTWVQDGGHVNGTFNFTLTSTDDGSANATVVVTVSTGSSTDPSVTPTGPVNLYGGESQVFIPVMAGTCSNSNGNWYFVTGNDGCSFDKYRTGQVVLYAPQTITSPSTIVIGYHPDEDPDRGAEIIVNLVPGTRNNTFQITNGTPLPNGTVGSQYGPVSLTTPGGTGTLVYSITWGNVPSPIVLNSSGVISSPTNLLVSSTNKFTVSVKDASLPPKWASKTFDLAVTSGGGTPTITSLDVVSGPQGGGTTIHVTGTNFLGGDVFVFGSQQFVYQAPAASTVVNSATSLTVVTPAWAGEVDVPSGVFINRSAVTVTSKSNAFTFMSGAQGFTVGTFSPTFAIVGSGDTVIDVFGTGFDSSCSIKYTASWGGGEQTLSSQQFINETKVRGTIASTNFSASHAGTTAAIKVIRVSDGASKTSGTTFNVQATTLSITTSSLPDGTRTSGYSQTLAATGGSGVYSTWSIESGSLPTGLSLDGGTGDISGTVGGSATSATFTARVTDSLGAQADKQFTINTIGGALTITTDSPLPDASINANYSKAILASGGTAPLTFDIVSGNLPIGLSIATDGVISGTPTSANAAPVTFGFTVRCTDSTGSPQIVTKAYSLTLNPALSTITITAVAPTSGPITGGTPVTITGTGFQNGCTVQFGNVAATNVVFTSSISIIATTPPAGAAGTVSVSVQNPDTGQGVFSGFEYKVLSTPVVTSIDRLDGPFAGGQIVVLSGSNFQGVSSIKFGLTELNSVVATFTPEDVVLGTVPQTITIVTPPGVTFGDGDTAVRVSIFITNASGTTEFPAGPDGYTYRPPPIITSVVPNSGPTSGGQTVYVIGRNFFQRGSVKPRIFIGNVEIPASSITLVEE